MQGSFEFQRSYIFRVLLLAQDFHFLSIKWQNTDRHLNKHKYFKVKIMIFSVGIRLSSAFGQILRGPSCSDWEFRQTRVYSIHIIENSIFTFTIITHSFYSKATHWTIIGRFVHFVVFIYSADGSNRPIIIVQCVRSFKLLNFEITIFLISSLSRYLNKQTLTMNKIDTKYIYHILYL